MEFYIDEKQKKKRRRILKIKIYGEIIIFLLLLTGLFYGIVYSPLLQIKQIDIKTSDVQNTRTSDVQILVNEIKSFFVSRSGFSKFLGADNILIWNNNVADFLKQRPDIVNLSIGKNYFNRTIAVNFQKREKFGIWCLIAQTKTDFTQINAEKNSPQESELNPRESTFCIWFDRSGVLFERAPRTEGKMIYKVNDFSERRLIVGERPLGKNLFENLLKIFNVLERADLNVRTLQIKNLSLQEVEVETDNFSMPKIYFSLRFDPEFSLAAFQSLKKIGLNKFEYIDFRAENRAYYKRK